MITFDKILLQNSCNPPQANVAIKWAEVVKLLSPGNNFYFTSSWWALVKICRSLKCLTKCFAVRLLLPFWYFSYQILPNARWFVTIWLDARNGLLLRHSGDSVERLHTDNSKFGCEPGKRNIWEQLDMTFPKGEEIHRVTRETWNSTFRYLKKKTINYFWRENPKRKLSFNIASEASYFTFTKVEEKKVNFWRDLENLKTVLPDRSILIGQKLMGNARIKNNRMRHFE